MEPVVSAMRIARKSLGLSPSKVASIAGLSEKYVFLIESGARNPSITTAVKCCLASGMTDREIADAISDFWVDEKSAERMIKLVREAILLEADIAKLIRGYS